MSLIKKILIALAAVIVVLVALTYLAAKKIYMPTTGAPIGKYENPSKALLVIDVQEDYTGSKGKQPPLFNNVDGPINTINQVIDTASKSGMQVVYIRQVFENNIITRNFIGRTIEGLPGTELDARITVVNNNDFTKKISDAFSNPQFESHLIGHQVDELYLVGLDAAYCVHKTARGALNRGYKVTVVTDAVMTRKNMGDVLKQYRQDGIRIMSSKELTGKLLSTEKNRRSEGYRLHPED